MTDELKIERLGHVLIATVDRQDRMNALNQAVHDGLREDLDVVEGGPFGPGYRDHRRR